MAERDISKFRRRQEELFKARQAEMIDRAQKERDATVASAEESADLEGQMAANKDSVIADLIERVLTVNLEVPRVVKQDFE